MKKTLYIDIETIPGAESGKDSVKVKVPANYKKQSTIDDYIADHKEEAYRKQSFDGGYGQVCAISAAVDDGEAFDIWLGNCRDAETAILNAAFAAIGHLLDGHSNPYVCGHFVSGFDLRFLMHRCVVLGVKMPHWLQTTCNAAAWSDKIRDTMTLWAGARGSISLDELCTILGIEGKGDIDGSMVYGMWLAGEHEKIGEYCSQDVEKVRAVNRKFLAAGL